MEESKDKANALRVKLSNFIDQINMSSSSKVTTTNQEEEGEDDDELLISDSAQSCHEEIKDSCTVRSKASPEPQRRRPIKSQQ